MSETKMRMTNEWLCRVQQLRADVDALRADIHPVRVSCERMRLPEWGDLDDADVAVGRREGRTRTRRGRAETPGDCAGHHHLVRARKWYLSRNCEIDPRGAGRNTWERHGLGELFRSDVSNIHQVTEERQHETLSTMQPLY